MEMEQIGGLLRASDEAAQGALGIYWHQGCLNPHLLNLKRVFPKIGPKHTIYAYPNRINSCKCWCPQYGLGLKMVQAYLHKNMLKPTHLLFIASLLFSAPPMLRFRSLNQATHVQIARKPKGSKHANPRGRIGDWMTGKS